jgi:homoserine dehydrogenase
MIPRNWLLADVAGAKNAVYVKSYALGPSLYYGAGAGMMPTAMSVVSDLIEVGRNLMAGASGGLPLRSYKKMQHRPLRSMTELRSRYYLRFGVLGDHEVSIAQVVQEGPRTAGRPVRVVVLSHEAKEGNLQHALAQIAKLSTVVEPAHVIRIAE